MHQWSLPCTLLLIALVGRNAAADEFPQATPESQGVRSEVLCEMSQWVRGEQLDVRSMLLLRHGNLVLEWYAGDVTRDHNHNIFSVTKSVVSALTGLAVRDGKLPGTGVTLAELFPDVSAVAQDPLKSQVTLDHLLTMQSGFRCARAVRPGPEQVLFDEIHAAPNRTEYILQLAMQRPAGEMFEYGNAEPQVVGSLVARAYGQPLSQVAQRVLFTPLGFRNARWVYADASGAVPGGYGLRLRAIDMAKLGQLFLQQGQWQGRPLLPQEWVRQSTADLTGSGYGYYWWTALPDDKGASFAAKGVRGQQIYVDPQRELVFVVTSDLPPDAVRETLAKLNGYVLEAATEEKPLPEQPAALAALKTELIEAAAYIPPNRNTSPPARLPQLP